MQRSCLRFLCFIIPAFFPMLVFAVSDKEMEQARVIAAKSYIRYVNDGSGYLDEINPTTLADLEKALKPKEKENIKAFLAIPVPKDYKDWDKQKLVEYWAVTAFQNKGLQEKGRGGRIRARSLINKMKIEPPKQQPVQSTASAEPNTAPAETPKPVASDTLSQDGIQNNMAVLENSQITEEDFPDEFGDIDIQKADNYTWVYIMVLCILVAIVIALVVYAANVMKKNSSEQPKYANAQANEESAEIRERLETAVADKDVEISMLSKKLETANRQNSELKAKIESLVAEVASLKGAIAASEQALRTSVKPISPVTEGQEGKLPKQPVLRSIFLGRANAKGIFVRADRTLNVGHSVFILETNDGYSGSFKVADSPAAWSLALSNPTEYLSAACAISGQEDTEGKSRIITESSGTAIFEGGCWRVIRKAKIRFE